MTRRPVVLVVGSLHHDIMIEADHLPRKDETAVGRRWFPKFGGKGGNQAVAAQAAGAAARMVGAVGKDDFGAFLLARLAGAGVDSRHVATLPDCGSGMSVAIQDGAGDYAATIVSGANLHLAPAALEAESIWEGVAILVLQNEITETMNLAAATEARRRGIPVLLNAAPAREVSEALRQQVDILVVNAIEAEMMGTVPVTDLDSALAAAEDLAARYEAVIVTAGSRGLAAWTQEDERIRLPAVKVNAVSSHGAGDCFVGTLAAAIAAGKPLPEACAIGAASAARHVAAPTTAVASGK
jgi:ribokinase